MRRLLIVTLAAAALGAVAAGAVSAAGGAPRGTVTAKSSRYGKVLFDGRGFVLYAFTADPRGKTRCSGACAAAWPPYIVKTRPRAAKSVAAKRLGTVRRPDGKLQGTYGGRPLYYYVGDTKPGLILCQNVREFGGFWRVVRPNGTLVTSG
jgi:predicted lipoprotein with Yx(FWY)xxD motif